MMDLFSELFDMFDNINTAFNTSPSVKDNRVCPVCGHSWEDFRRSGKFGCSACYETFKNGASQVLRQVHSSSEHRGKIPSKSGAEVKAKRRLEELRRQLKEAVAAEDYEKAAKLHSEIKQIEGGGIK
jgi:protein arginine kinase activator